MFLSFSSLLFIQGAGMNFTSLLLTHLTFRDYLLLAAGCWLRAGMEKEWGMIDMAKTLGEMGHWVGRIGCLFVLFYSIHVCTLMCLFVCMLCIV